MKSGNSHGIGWREYQRYLKSKDKKKRILKGFFKVIFYILLPFGLVFFLSKSFILMPSKFTFRQVPQKAKIMGGSGAFSLDRIRVHLTKIDPSNLDSKNVLFLRLGHDKLKIRFFLDIALQSYTKRLLRRSRTLSSAAVIMEPDTGKIITMVDIGRKKGPNLCLKPDFPAASLFKIVVASAVIEERSFAPEKRLYFTGKRHTLYRGQLENHIRGYVNTTSLKMAFAKSINPVFGKIGIYELGRETIQRYAERFLFNKEIHFDIPCKRSRVSVPEDDFGIAEIASGFNKKTLISPLHAVLMGAGVANNGVIMRPLLIESIEAERGRNLYQAKPSILQRVITSETSLKIKELMEATVKYGTCRSSFRPLMRRSGFRRLSIGAKTGSVNDELDRIKFDWLVAYAIPPEKDGGVVLSVLAIHGKRLGIRARDLGRYIIEYYFSKKKNDEQRLISAR